MNEKLTIEEFDKLLDAYVGAVSHVSWVREHGTVQMHSIAVDAAVIARNALLRSVFPDQRND